MKNLNFVDPEVVSKQEILANLKKEGYFSFSSEFIEWFDSITNEVDSTPDESDVVYRLLKTADYKPALLFNSSFFPDVPDDSASFLNRFFRTELLNDERIKSIPLLFEKVGDKEMFDLRVRKINKGIKAHCIQNKEFAEAYQAKLAEIRNNNGSLRERLVLYIDLIFDNIENSDLFFELEQPAFEMVIEFLNAPDLLYCASLRDTYNPCILLLELSFIFLLETPDGMQIPRWDEKNYLCRLLLDYEIVYNVGILDKLFRDYSSTDVFLIICNHFKWRYDNMPQNQEERTQFLKAQLSELFSDDILYKYLDLLYFHFFLLDRQRQSFLQNNTLLYNKQYYTLCINPFSHMFPPCKQPEEPVQSNELGFLYFYLMEKIALTMDENNHEQLRDISRLFDNENKDWIENINWEIYTDEVKKEFLEGLQSQISFAMKFFESGDNTEKLRDMLKDRPLVESILLKIKNKEDKNIPPLSLEDFVLKYIPLKVFPGIFGSRFFQKQNENVYQNMIQQYPGLSREEALRDRLLPCFVAIAIKNTDEMVALLTSKDRYAQYSPASSNEWKYSAMVQLFLYVLDQLCERYEKEHESIALIFEIVFKKQMNCVPIMFDIIKKYPQVQQLVIEQCYTFLKGSWDTPICTPLSSRQIHAIIPARTIGMHKGTWQGLKPLLIALRKTRMEWVDASLDMNYKCRPNGNNNLVEEINWYFDFFSDSLKSLRQDMADGLSDWLKPLPESKRGNLEKRLTEFTEIEQDREGFDITYTEPDPVWRYAYVRAIADLEVDVDGKGHYIHSVMDMVAKEDPSEMVRKAAEKASAKLKNLRNGRGGDDHFQKINLAFWWIKQASRLALNLPIDEKKSLQTRGDDGRKKDYYDKEKERKKEKDEKEQKQWEEKERKKQREIEKFMRARLRI